LSSSKQLEVFHLNTELEHPGVVYALKAAMNRSGVGMISFRDYMDICLYNEPDGYYRNANQKIGKDGDFYTSSSIGSVMGEMVAAFIREQIGAKHHENTDIHIVEWGGGNGRLALHVLDEMKRIAPSIYERVSYTMIETSTYHRQLQMQTLDSHSNAVRFMSDKEWLMGPPLEDVYVLANELLDAFPVHRIQYQDKKYYESYVVWNEASQAFEENWIALDSKLLLDFIGHLNVQWTEGQIAEVNLDAEAWIGAVAKQIISGGCIIIDYGDCTEELYAAHRWQGTLMCYRKHQAHDNPFEYQGLQDITSHVNFSRCLEVALESGFTGGLLQTQREFLVEQGILQKLQDHFDPNPFSPISKRNRAIRQILLSDQMSELFKVLIAMKKR
jgi:SAM-dependent MidA family methyltransferase